MFSIANVPDGLAREIYAELCKALPPPFPDTPEARTARDERAMAAVAALIPENAFEAELAAQIVARDFHAKHALRDASRPNLTVDALNSYRNQASRMDRDSQSGVRNLLRVQAVRRKAEDAARPAAMERAGYWYKDSLEMAVRPLPLLAPEPDDDASPPGEPPRRVLSQMDPAEQYAALYPQRAALIRAFGGLPPNINFGAPEPDLVDAIVASTSPIMLALDQEVAALTGVSPSKSESRQTISRDTDDTEATTTPPHRNEVVVGTSIANALAPAGAPRASTHSRQHPQRRIGCAKLAPPLGGRQFGFQRVKPRH